MVQKINEVATSYNESIFSQLCNGNDPSWIWIDGTLSTTKEGQQVITHHFPNSEYGSGWALCFVGTNRTFPLKELVDKKGNTQEYMDDEIVDNVILGWKIHKDDIEGLKKFGKKGNYAKEDILKMIDEYLSTVHATGKKVRIAKCCTFHHTKQALSEYVGPRTVKTISLL